MNEDQVASRYARAVFEIGEESGRLIELSSEIALFAQQFANKELSVPLTDPVIGESRRFSMIEALGARLGLGTTTINTLKLLARRRRLPALPGIARELQSLTDQRQGLVRVKVTSAKPLSDAYYERLVGELEQSLQRKVALEKTVDPELIAGLLVQIGNNTIDGTVSGRLESYEHQLLLHS